MAASPFLQILFDDSGDDADGNAAFLVQTGDGKADSVLFSGHSPVIAGVGNCVDAVIKTDEHNAVAHIGHSAGIFALQNTLIQIALVGIGQNAADVRCDGDAVDVAAVNGKYTDKDPVADAVIFVGVAEPCVRQISRKDRALHAEYIYPQRLFRDTDDTGLYDPPFIDQGLAVLIGVQIEGLPLAKHGALRLATALRSL